MSTARDALNFDFKDNKTRKIALPELLISAKHIGEKKLHELMNVMFNNTDDCLFEYADKAANNEQQTLYLHAMREIRLKKTDMEKTFFADFDCQFNRLLSDSDNNLSIDDLYRENGYSSATALSLVDDEEFEESLAITNMVSRVYSECREPLSAMIQRIDEVYDGKEVTKDTNPLSPDVVCNAFSKAVTCLSANLEIKLIVYKLFDKFVVRHMGKLYHEINEMFVAAGILPTIKYKMPVRQPSSTKTNKPADDVDAYLAELNEGQVTPQPGAHVSAGSALIPQAGYAAPSPVGATTDPHNANIFEAMRQALYFYRGEDIPQDLDCVSDASGNVSGVTATGCLSSITGLTQPNSVQTSSLQTGDGDSVPGGTIYYVTSDIIAGLSSIQNSRAITENLNESGNSGEVIKSKVLQAVVGTQGDQDEKTINSADADIIDIVSMMFDYILNDKSLPDRTKAVISRLQIPMVKVAILDKTFFNRKNHPARQLLDELANASSVLDSDYDDADTLFKEIEHVVGRILNEFDSNVELFEELLSEFLNFLDREIQANRLAEQMVLETRKTVAEEIEKRLLHRQVPEAVKQFILGPWKEVMTTIGISEQCEGIAWNSASTFLDDLIWSVQPKLFNDERHQLTMLIPRMLPALREGMALLENNSYDLPKFLEELQQIHLKVLHVHKPRPVSRKENIHAFADATGDEELFDEMDADETSMWENVNEGEDSLSGKHTASQDDFMDDIIMQGDKHDRYQFDMSDPDLIQSRFFNPVRTMEIGTWVEFNNGEGSKRGKLTWKCDFTGEYTFINRMYKVVADIGMRDLIYCMEAGSAHIVEDTPMFDRAVNAIMNTMTSMRAAAQPA